MYPEDFLVTGNVSPPTGSIIGICWLGGICLSGLWNCISLWCLNHKEPKKMELIRNDDAGITPFFACDSYISRNIAGGEPCSNRLNYDDYVDIITGKGGFMEKYAEDPFTQLTGYSFTYKKRKHKIFVKVLKSSFNDIRIGVYNETVLGKREAQHAFAGQKSLYTVRNCYIQ